MEKDINTEVSNTQLPATEEKANLKESLRIQKSQWIKEQIKRQREAEERAGSLIRSFRRRSILRFTR